MGYNDELNNGAKSVISNNIEFVYIDCIYMICNYFPDENL